MNKRTPVSAYRLVSSPSIKQKLYVNSRRTPCNSTPGLFYSFISQIYVPSVVYISQLSYTYSFKIMAIFQPFEFGENQFSMLSPYLFILLNSKFFVGVNQSQQNSKNWWCFNIFSFLSFYSFPSHLRFFSQLSPFLNFWDKKKSFSVNTLYLIHHTLGFTIILYTVNRVRRKGFPLKKGSH